MTTPDGGAPSDPNFIYVTVQQLLEHTSGLPTDVDPLDVLAASQAAAPPGVATYELPVTQEMTDAYIATLPFTSAPGVTQNYSNLGYYLLSRIAAKLCGRDQPVDAYHGHLFAPLGITRIRAAVDLLVHEPTDEARYQAAWSPASSPDLPGYPVDLATGSSVMTPDRPVVATGYGDLSLAIGGCRRPSATSRGYLPSGWLLVTRRRCSGPRSRRCSTRPAISPAPSGGPGTDSAPGVTDARAFYGQKSGLITMLPPSSNSR